MATVCDVVNGYIDMIHRIIPELHKDISNIVITYVIDELLLHLITQLDEVSNTKLSNIRYAYWTILPNTQESINIRVKLAVCATDRWFNDEIYSNLTTVRFIKIMSEMQLNHHLRERFWITKEHEMAGLDHWNGLFDRIAKDIVRKFIESVKTAIVRLM